MIKKDKYNVSKEEKNKEKRTHDGILFSSEMEMKFYRDVLIPEKQSGIIKNIIIQPKYLLQPKFQKNGKNYQPINYVGDFEVEYSDGTIVTFDVKGLSTETAKIKKKIWDYVYPNRKLEWITLSQKYGGWIEYETLQKLRSKNKKKNEPTNV
jgi:hypothetical protein